MKARDDTYVFISYASANRSYARELYNRLTGRWHRIPCWMDEFDIQVDEHEFQEHIIQGIQHASALVLVRTDEAMRSVYVGREVAEAKATGIPVFQYRIKSYFTRNAPLASDEKSSVLQGADKVEVTAKANSIFRHLRIAWLAFRIKLRITQPFWLATLALGVVTLGLALGIFFLTKAFTQQVVDVIQRSLPEAVEQNDLSSPASLDQDPAAAAPFHFVADNTLLVDDFAIGGDLDETVYPYDIKPTHDQVKIYRQDGSLHLEFPNQCLEQDTMWNCETEIHTQYYPLSSIQYVALRARLLEKTPNHEISLSISTTGPRRYRTGFGWAFSGHVTPFFRANPNLPEEDYYAYLPVDDQWHAYEIVLNPETAELYFYMDGQLIERVSMDYYEEWKNAPLMLITYALTVESIPTDQLDQVSSPHLEIDQIIVGGFD
jgi:hypothetical protein